MLRTRHGRLLDGGSSPTLPRMSNALAEHGPRPWEMSTPPPTGAPYADTVVASNSSAWGASQKNGIDPGRTIHRTLTQDDSGSNPHGADVRGPKRLMAYGQSMSALPG